MKVKLFNALALSMLLLSACSGGGERIFSEVTGKEGEIMMCWEQSLWNSSVKNTVEEVFNQDLEAMPLTGYRDAEKEFRVMNIAPEGFANVFRKHRNVVKVKFVKEYKKAVHYNKNLWAKPQSVATIHAKDTSDLVKNLRENKDRLRKFFMNSETERIQYVYKKLLDDPNLNVINKEYNIDLILPRVFKKAVTKPNFEWFQYIVKGASQQHLYIFSYNYQDPKTFTKEFLMNKIDTVLKNNVQSGEKGAYMEINRERDVVFNEFKTEKLSYVAEIKSLWRLNGGFMGGPFRAYSFLDEANNKVITVCGAVFAPQSKKRNLVRELESILMSLELLPTKTAKENS